MKNFLKRKIKRVINKRGFYLLEKKHLDDLLHWVLINANQIVYREKKDERKQKNKKSNSIPLHLLMLSRMLDQVDLVKQFLDK